MYVHIYISCHCAMFASGNQQRESWQPWWMTQLSGAEAAHTHCPSQSCRSTAPHEGRTSGLGVTAEDNFPPIIMEGSTHSAAVHTKGMGADDTTATVSPAETKISLQPPTSSHLPWITALMKAVSVNTGQGLQPYNPGHVTVSSYGLLFGSEQELRHPEGQTGQEMPQSSHGLSQFQYIHLHFKMCKFQFICHEKPTQGLP